MGWFKKSQQKREPDRFSRYEPGDEVQVPVWTDQSGLHQDHEAVPVGDQMTYADFCEHAFWEVYRRLYRRHKDPWVADLEEVRETLMWMSPLVICHDLEEVQAQKWMTRLLSEFARRWPVFVLDRKFYN